MKKLWITYAWEDNKDEMVDFIAQELEKLDIEVRLDRWDLTVGDILWPQIEKYIDNPEESDAWAIVATTASLTSRACQEELYYALGRALEKRTNKFPIIGIFPSPVAQDLIPPVIKTRLYVTLLDEMWHQRVAAAVKGEELKLPKVEIKPFYCNVFKSLNPADKKIYIELRPMAGSWTAFKAFIPVEEKEIVNPDIKTGAVSTVPNPMMHSSEDGYSKDKKWFMVGCDEEVTPIRSVYIICDRLPSKLTFTLGGTKMAEITLNVNQY